MSLYKNLGLDPTATIAQVKKAYRTLSKVYHPDSPDGSADKFNELKLAYDVLSNAERRARYDKTGRTDVSPVTPEAIKNAMSSMIHHVIDAEREDGSTDNPEWEDIRYKIIASIQAGRRGVVMSQKQIEKKLVRARTLKARFHPKQEEDPVGDIIQARIEGMENDLKNCKDALELSQEIEKAFKQYDYEVGPRPEGQFSPGPTLRLSGFQFTS